MSRMNTSANITKIADKMADDERGKEFAARWLADDVTRKVESAVQQSERMIRDLQKLIEDLQGRGADANFNTLGEIQGRGSELDRTLGEIAVMRKMLDTIANMR